MLLVKRKHNVQRPEQSCAYKVFKFQSDEFSPPQTASEQYGQHGAVALQIREEHWIIADLIGKGKHIRTVPVPAWVKATIDDWIAASGINKGIIFRRVNRTDGVWGEGITPKAVWHVVKAAAKRSEIKGLAPHDLRRTCARLCQVAGGELDQIQFLPGHASVRRQSDTSAVSRNFATPSTTTWASRFPDASAPRPPTGLLANQLPYSA